MKMPVHFLQESGKGFFVKKDGFALALRDEMIDIVTNPIFVKEVKDAINYRALDY